MKAVAGRDGTRLQHKCPRKKSRGTPFLSQPRHHNSWDGHTSYLMIVATEQEHSLQDRATLFCLAFVTPQLEHNTELGHYPSRRMYSINKGKHI